MPIRLGLRINNPAISTFEGLKISVELKNEDSRPYTIPDAYDQTSAFTIEVSHRQSGIVRKMNGVTKQGMLTTGRIDERPNLDTLRPGRTWKWELDLSPYHYTLPAGVFEIQGVYRYSPEGIDVRSDTSSIEVSDAAPSRIDILRDNPVLDRLHLLFELQRDGCTEYWLRNCNYGNPLAAWYSGRILVGVQAQNPIVASAAFFQTKTFDSFFSTWVVWREGNTLLAEKYLRDQRLAIRRSAPMPEDLMLLPFACYTAEDDLYVFFQSSAPHLEAYVLKSSGFVRAFDRPLTSEADRKCAIAADENSVHVVSPFRGLHYERMTFKGELLAQKQLMHSRLAPYSYGYDPTKKVAKAAFSDQPHGKTVQMVFCDPRNDIMSQCFIDNIPLRHEVRELSFDRGHDGRFHMLVSTSDNKLYYIAENRGPFFVAEGADLFFPHIIAESEIFLGCYQPGLGYRYLRYDRHEFGSRIAKFEKER